MWFRYLALLRPLLPSHRIRRNLSPILARLLALIRVVRPAFARLTGAALLRAGSTLLT